MAEKKFCTNPSGKGKVSYRTEAAAFKAARATRSGLGLHVYACRHCQAWHLSKQEPLHKAEVIPSASKLRRRLENYGREIAAAQRRFDESQAILRAAQEKAQAENAEVERALEVMYRRSR